MNQSPFARNKYRATNAFKSSSVFSIRFRDWRVRSRAAIQLAGKYFYLR